MLVSDFDYELPKGLIAQRPLSKRDISKLMVVADKMTHSRFHTIVDYLEKGDVLVVNNSKVIPARLKGRKETGGRIGLLILKRKRGLVYEAQITGRVKPGDKIIIGDAEARVLSVGEKSTVEFDKMPDIENEGEMPTPPYIEEPLQNSSEYQTVYAEHEGSVAAPTAGFHFTPELLCSIQAKGVELAAVTLHVGLGTFLPVRCEDVREHRMHSEEYFITQKDADTINNRTGRLIVVGTTTLRCLESSADDGLVTPGQGEADLFIYPGYRFRVRPDALVTNFHLPRSTLIMLVSAYAGRERIMQCYKEAIEKGYRFYSFGDAMMIFG